MRTIAGISVEKIYNTTIANFIEAGIITAEEKDNVRQKLEEMSQEELLGTLIESHCIVEDIRKILAFHISDRLN